MKQQLKVAIPSYSGRITADTMTTVLNSSHETMAVGFDDWAVQCYCGDARIAHVRNWIVADFYASGFSHLLMLDDDVSAEAGTVAKMLRHRVDFIAGVYRARKDPEEYAIRWLGEEGNWYMAEDPATGLLEVASVPAGFLLITRACVERMMQAYPQGAFRNKKCPVPIHRLFDEDPSVLGLEGDWGEDFMFCQRWRRIGGKVLVDPSPALTHLGDKAFKGSLAGWLKSGADQGKLQRVLHKEAA